MLFRRRSAAFLLALLILIAAQLTACASIKVVAEPGADPAHVAMVQKTADAFNAIVSQDLGVTLDKDVRVFVCPDRDSYRAVLGRELGLAPDVAARSAKVSGGFSTGRSNAVAVHFDTKGSSAEMRAYKTTAHELFHQLQYQLAGEKMGASYYWLKEGTADLIGAAVAEKVGFQSLEKWKLDQLNVLRKADKHASPHEILTTDLDRWTALMETNQHPYQMADLMVLYLMTRTKTGYRAIADYYSLLGKGVANEAAFAQAFGLPPADAVADFQAWFFGVTSQAAAVEVIAAPEVPAENLADYNRGVDLARQFLATVWGRDLQSMMRFVLVSGKPAYAAAMAREFGIAAAEAEQRAKNTTWWYSGSTTVYDTTAFATGRQRIFSVAGSLARRSAAETAPAETLGGLFWLHNGACDIAAAHVVERSGAFTVEQYRRSWLAALAKDNSYPSLAGLASAAGWREASAKHGSGAASRVMLLACLHLADKHGPAAFAAWFRAAKETGDAEAAFRQVFGMTLDEFYNDFAGYLQTKLKKAS